MAHKWLEPKMVTLAGWVTDDDYDGVRDDDENDTCVQPIFRLAQTPASRNSTTIYVSLHSSYPLCPKELGTHCSHATLSLFCQTSSFPKVSLLKSL